MVLDRQHEFAERQLEVDIKAISDHLDTMSQQDGLCSRLRQVPAFGPLLPPPRSLPSVTEPPSGVGGISRPGLGILPRQYSSRGRQQLFGISKRGNNYLRCMLIHGARAVLLRVKYDTGGFGQ